MRWQRKTEGLDGVAASSDTAGLDKGLYILVTNVESSVHLKQTAC